MKAVTLCIIFSLVAYQMINAQSDMENKPTKNTYSKLPAGPEVFGVFDGRTPCQEIAKELQQNTSPDCFKLKWRFVLYQDPTTKKPTRFTIASTFHRTVNQKGTWSIVRGTNQNKDAVVFHLAPEDGKAPLYLLKGDENVLFFLDHSKNLLAGNAQFSYTLNRVGN
jgi:hypothetical protein